MSIVKICTIFGGWGFRTELSEFALTPIQLAINKTIQHCKQNETKS